MLTFVHYYSLALPILSTLWVVVDSSRHRIASNDAQPYSATNGALVWLLACVLIWIAALPIYLARRASQLGNKRGSVIGAGLLLSWVILVVAANLGKLPLSTEDVRQVALKSMTETLAPKNIQVESLSLDYVSGDEYKGVVALTAAGQHQEIPVEVHCKDDQVRWQIHRPK